MNCDFKVVEGLEARRFRKLGSKVLSPDQYVVGVNKKIHHGIAKARDAIQAATKSKIGCGIADTDFVAAFDWLVLSWVWKVLRKLGVNEQVITRVKNLYLYNIPGNVFLEAWITQTRRLCLYGFVLFWN